MVSEGHCKKLVKNLRYNWIMLRNSGQALLTVRRLLQFSLSLQDDDSENFRDLQ